MDNEQQKYKLRDRSRSRSETPHILAQTIVENEVSDHQYELRNRSRDRSVTPGKINRSRSSSRSLPTSVIKTSNKNLDIIAERKDDTLEDKKFEIQNKSLDKTLVVTKSIRKTERRSERQRIKKEIVSNGKNEVKGDYSNIKCEIKDIKRESITPKRIMTSDYSSEEGDREDVPSRPNSAYEFYKQHDEYWNKFPKTDYTYSPASTCRYEVAPGVMAIPNMSRRSLHSDNSFINGQVLNNQNIRQSFNNSYNENKNKDEIYQGLSDTVPDCLPHNVPDTVGQSVIYKRTHVEQYTTRREFIYDSAKDNQINERYESWANPLLNFNKVNHYRDTTNVDSDAEPDEAIVSNRRYQLKNNQGFNISSSFISIWFYKMFHFITFGLFKRREFLTSHFYRRYEETKWSRFQLQINTVMQQLYLLLIKVVLLDSWLLSRVSNIRERAQGRRTKILWLIFLPFLIITVCWFLPYILSTILLFLKQMLYQIKEESLTRHSYSQEVLKSSLKLRNIVNLLISRVQYLEAAKVKQSEHLYNVTQDLEEVKRNDIETWKHYNERLQNLEQALKEQNNDEKSRSKDFDHIRVEVETLKNLYQQLKSCCTMHATNDENIKKQIDTVFTEYFGNSFSKEDIVRIFLIMNQKLQHENNQKLNEEKIFTSENSEHINFKIDEMRKLILEILKIYDADKTGRVDYALESAGGHVISIRCTQQYNIKTRVLKIMGFTIPYSSDSNDPRTVIQGNKLQPGICWAFQGFPGHLLIKLRSQINVTGFTLEHASRFNLPNGEMKSAPKKFNVWGLKTENDKEPVLFGEYEFLDSDDNLQYFPVQNTLVESPYEYVELKIHSNHGQLEYTCLYRFRIHGNLV